MRHNIYELYKQIIQGNNNILFSNDYSNIYKLLSRKIGLS